jgi:protein-S-isoprenylcysteine O-methyltransferase Ste14
MVFLDYVVIFCECVWGGCEFWIYTKMKSSEDNADQKSYKVLYRITLLGLLTGIFIGDYLKFDNLFSLYHPNRVFPIVGIGLMVLGMTIRLTAINQLKRFFTINVAIRDDHQLITGGLYKVIRHPAYTGGILTFIGCGLCYGNLLSFLFIAIPYIILILNRITVEEVILEKKFGEAYTEMKRRTKKLIPFVY